MPTTGTIMNDFRAATDSRRKCRSWLWLLLLSLIPFTLLSGACFWMGRGLLLRLERPPEQANYNAATTTQPQPQPLNWINTKEMEISHNATNTSSSRKNHHRRHRRHRRQLLQTTTTRKRPLKILYTVTTLSEYDEGGRATTRGNDRLQKLLIPVLKEGVESMLSFGYQVDVYIIAHYSMTREHLIRQALPSTVKITVWDNAAPYTYEPDKRENPKAKLWLNTLALARQHRFVVKDHLFDYDLFCNFEDDMIIKGDHVQNHLELTQALYRLRETAPDQWDKKEASSFAGQLTKEQLKRIFPGLMRVEVLLNEERDGSQKQKDPVPVMQHDPIDPRPCCHLSSNRSASPTRPQSPSSDKLFIWETGIQALGVRRLPDLGWVAMLRGPRGREPNVTIDDYWSNSQHYFGKGVRRPAGGAFEFINNQGGWMATRQQIWEWHSEICPGGFLPPFESPHYNFDGTDMRNVEYWSGGLNLFTARHACNMYRIVHLDNFAKHLIYHSSNNKQRQLKGKSQRFVKVDDLYGQLLTVQKDAQAALKDDEEAW